MKTKVLYVIGSQRGGTTIAGRLMGQLPGFAFVGEVRKLFQLGLPEGRSCGCGRRYDTCEVWSAVLPTIVSIADIFQMRRWQHAAVPDHWSSLGALRLARNGRSGISPAARSYALLLTATYRALAKATGAKVIVDTSKLPADALLVSSLENVDPYFVQVVRDPRGTIHSIIRRSSSSRSVHIQRAVSGSAGWLVRQLAGNALRRRVGPDRSLLITYEDLIADPDTVLAGIATMMGEPTPAASVMEDHLVEFAAGHTPVGAGRFVPRSVRLTRDERWMTDLSIADRLVVSAITQPLGHQYGYRLSAPAPSMAKGADSSGMSIDPSTSWGR